MNLGIQVKISEVMLSYKLSSWNGLLTVISTKNFRKVINDQKWNYKLGLQVSLKLVGSISSW